MYLMIDFWFLVLCIWIVSQIMWLTYRRLKHSVIGAILNVCAFIGIVIHEFSHLIVGILCGMPAHQIRIKWRSEHGQNADPHGSVSFGDFYLTSFMKGLMICFAPLLIATFVVFVCIDVIVTIQTDLVVNLIALFIAVSTALGAAPSKADLRNLGGSIANDPLLAIGQMLCFGTSIFISIQFMNLSQLVLPFEFMYYAIYFLGSLLIYFITFHSCRVMKWSVKRIFNIQLRSNRWKLRKRIKTKKPSKEKEDNWW